MTRKVQVLNSSKIQGVKIVITVELRLPLQALSGAVAKTVITAFATTAVLENDY